MLYPMDQFLFHIFDEIINAPVELRKTYKTSMIRKLLAKSDRMQEVNRKHRQAEAAKKWKDNRAAEVERRRDGGADAGSPADAIPSGNDQAVVLAITNENEDTAPANETETMVDEILKSNSELAAEVKKLEMQLARLDKDHDDLGVELASLLARNDHDADTIASLVEAMDGKDEEVKVLKDRVFELQLVISEQDAARGYYDRLGSSQFTTPTRVNVAAVSKKSSVPQQGDASASTSPLTDEQRARIEANKAVAIQIRNAVAWQNDDGRDLGCDEKLD